MIAPSTCFRFINTKLLNVRLYSNSLSYNEAAFSTAHYRAERDRSKSQYHNGS